MAIPSIPSIEVIKNRIVSDIESSIGQTVPFLPLAFLKIVASASAGTMFLLYQSIVWCYKQIFPESADYFNLVLLGKIVDITLVGAVAAEIECTITGSGAQVDAGETFIGTNEVIYRVTTNTAIVAGTALDVPLLALTSGDIGNLANGEVLDIQTNNLNPTGTATITDTTTSGADEESKESFSARISLRYRTRFIAGTPGGYALYGLETPNFTWVGPTAHPTLPSFVNVYGKVDNQTDGIPTTAQLVELKSYLSDDPETGKTIRRPVGDNIVTLPITIRQFDIEIFISNSNPALNAKIQTAIEAYIENLEPYIIGVSGDRNDVLTEAGATESGNAIAKTESALITQSTITDVTTGLNETNYSLLGGIFGKFRTVAFTVVV